MEPLILYRSESLPRARAWERSERGVQGTARTRTASRGDARRPGANQEEH